MKLNLKKLGLKLILSALLFYPAAGAFANTETVELLTGQSEGTWGTGSSNPQDPFNTWYTNSRAQSVYLASELTDAGIPQSSFTSLHFKCYQEPGRSNLKDIRIHMKHTSDDTSTAWDGDISDPAGDWTLVYGPEDVLPTEGQWYEFELHTPFEWDGTSNIMIDINRDDSNFSLGGGMYIRTGGLPQRTYAARRDWVDWTHDLSLHQILNHVPSMKITYIPRGPEISLSTGSLSFTAVLNDDPPPAQSFTVANTGPESTILRLQASGNEDWLRVALPRRNIFYGGQERTVDVFINHSELEAGTYQGQITVFDPNASNSPKVIDVSLEVLPPQLVEVSSTYYIRGPFVNGALDSAVDSSGNIIVTGTGNGDFMTVKYDFMFSKTLSTAVFPDTGNTDIGSAVAVDSDDNIILGGIHNVDAIIVKCDPDLDILNVWTDVGPGFNAVADLTVDSDDNIVAIVLNDGSFFTVKLDPGLNPLGPSVPFPGEAGGVAVDHSGNIIVTGKSGDNYHTIKYDSSLNPISSVSSSASGSAHGAAVNSKGDIIITGESEESYYTILYDSDLNKISSASYSRYGSSATAHGVAVDSMDNIIITGECGSDFYTIVYNPDLKEIFSARDDSGGSDQAFGVTVDRDDNIIVNGRSSNSFKSIKYAYKPMIPGIIINNRSLKFAASESINPSDKSFNITNSGIKGSGLIWNADSSVPWITLSKESGTLAAGERDTVNVSVDQSSLEPGLHTGQITITDPYFLPGKSQTIDVEFRILPAMTVFVEGGQVNFTAVSRGGSPGGRYIRLTNSGIKGSTFNWTADKGSPDWLILSSTYGVLHYGQSVNIDLSVDISNLSTDQYEAEVLISYSNPTIFTPHKVKITLSVLAAEAGEIIVRGGREGYVNPDFGEKAEIIFNAKKSGTVNIKVFDRRGRLVWEDSKTTAGGNDFFEWACDNIRGNVVASGVYIVHINGPGINTTSKIAVVR